mmetsp:Transcript_9534/g.21889  ORF Transcript_9534/g.21889 Transcript_9534/m.21889 type:complete len:373 (+) Transcript_9534:3891-5009(+)
MTQESTEPVSLAESLVSSSPETAAVSACPSTPVFTVAVADSETLGSTACRSSAAWVSVTSGPSTRSAALTVMPPSTRGRLASRAMVPPPSTVIVPERCPCRDMAPVAASSRTPESDTATSLTVSAGDTTHTPLKEPANVTVPVGDTVPDTETGRNGDTAKGVLMLAMAARARGSVVDEPGVMSTVMCVRVTPLHTVTSGSDPCSQAPAKLGGRGMGTSTAKLAAPTPRVPVRSPETLQAAEGPELLVAGLTVRCPLSCSATWSTMTADDSVQLAALPASEKEAVVVALGLAVMRPEQVSTTTVGLLSTDTVPCSSTDTDGLVLKTPVKFATTPEAIKALGPMLAESTTALVVWSNSPRTSREEREVDARPRV